MKLSIRVKFFIVLLAFSLGPVFLSRAIMGRTAAEMATNLSSSTRTELLAIVRAELEHNAMSMLATLNARGEAMSLGARLLALRAGHFLDRGDPAPADSLHFVGQFSMPVGMMSSERRYVRKGRMGGARALNIDSSRAAVRFAPSGDKAGALLQLRKLQPLLPTLKVIYGELGDTPYWMNIALDSGGYMTFPGHGNLPMMYDHRDQEWYKRARDADDGCVWTTPVLDPATKGGVATVACPVRDREGRFLGTASIEVPITDILGDSDLKSRWSDDILSFMTLRPGKDFDPSAGLVVLAQQSYVGQGRHHWMSGIEREYLKSGDAEGFGQLIRAMRQTRSGIAALPYNGKPCVWAYASNKDLSFLLIAPESVVSKLPDQVAGSMTALFARVRSLSAVMAAVMLLVTGFIAWMGSRRITRPLLAMVDAVKRMAKGDFSARIDHRTGDERDALINAFNEMGPQLEERMVLRRDLELAQEVQNLLLPRHAPDLPGWDVSGGIAFCDQTGGDYYDFIPLEDPAGEALGVVIGDVSGHGVPSALVMATARGQLHALAEAPFTSGERIEAVNRVLSRDLDGTGRFLTFFSLRLTANVGEVCWVRAGHDPAIRYTPATGEFGELEGEGLPLGVMEEAEYLTNRTVIEPGEVLVMATDGVWEARNGEGEMFGKQRMLAIIGENAHKSAQDIRRAIMDAVEVYQENGQSDDIAVVAVKRLRG
jgi:sigma-B regulation protein RsbU (phosphoserine phosphatase)